MTDQPRRRSARPFWLGEDLRKWDHVRLHVQVIKDPQLGAYEQAIYAGIACHAELQTGEATPGAELLAYYAQCDERTVRRVLARLREAGYVEVVPRPGLASIYRLLPPPPLGPGAESGVGVPGAGLTVRAPRAESPRGPGTESDEQERTNQIPPNPPEGGIDRLTPRAEGRSPRQLSARARYLAVLREIDTCDTCGEFGWECTRCSTRRRAAETELQELEVPRALWSATLDDPREATA